MISGNDRVRWYVVLNRTAFILGFGGVCVIATGLVRQWPASNTVDLTHVREITFANARKVKGRFVATNRRLWRSGVGRLPTGPS